jgi:DNA-binding Lrp family transcriptional regulator
MIPGWVDAIEEEVRSCLRSAGRVSARELAEALGVSEESAVSYITLLAASGRLRIEAVSLPADPTFASGDARLATAA